MTTPTRNPPIAAPAQAAEAADDGADEGDDDELQAHPRLDDAGLCDDEAGDRGGKHAADREGGGDHPVGAHAQHPGHAEILGRGAHLQPEAGGPEEPGQPDEQDGADHDGDELQALQPDPADFDLASQLGQEVDALGAGVDEEDQRLLEKEADREGGDEQRRRVGAAERAEGDAFGGKGEEDGDQRPPNSITGSGRPKRARSV